MYIHIQGSEVEMLERMAVSLQVLVGKARALRYHPKISQLNSGKSSSGSSQIDSNVSGLVLFKAP